MEFLQAEQGGVFLDCTFGGGGHTSAILESNEINTVCALDRDSRALERGQELVQHYQGRLKLTKGTFVDLADITSGQTFDGVIADLGISTDQIYEERGFSFHDTDRLDMRMDENQELTADDVVNTYEEHRLKKVLLVGGVGKEAGNIARAIVRARPIQSPKALADLVKSVLAYTKAKKTVHPATVVFQALRIEVNNEFKQITSLLQAVPSMMNDGGRLAVISFHSLEDKLVAKTMRSWQGEEFSALWPGEHSSGGIGKLLTKKAVVPSEQEQASNPSSRSARMRVFEFLQSKSRRG